MKATAIVFAMAVLWFGFAGQSTACDRIDFEGVWTLVANGYTFQFEVVGDSHDNFYGTIRRSGEPMSRAYDGACYDGSRRFTFIRKSQPVGKFEQHFTGYFWKRNNVTGVAGTFTSNSKIRGFYMTKSN